MLLYIPVMLAAVYGIIRHVTKKPNLTCARDATLHSNNAGMYYKTSLMLRYMSVMLLYVLLLGMLPKSPSVYYVPAMLLYIPALLPYTRL